MIMTSVMIMMKSKSRTRRSHVLLTLVMRYMSSSSMTSMDLSKNKTDKPMQPVIKYPPTKFVQPTGQFQSRWYETIPVVRIFHQF